MLKKTRDYNAAECMFWMYGNNRGKIYIFMQKNVPCYLISLVPIHSLKFPDGWFYSENTKTINNENSTIKFSIIVKE